MFELRAVIALMFVAACAGGGNPPAPAPGVPEPGTPDAPVGGTLPAIPLHDGTLQVDVVYPPAGSTIAVRDSNFIFGSTGSGQATLRINGASVDVAPNGAFLAFLPVPPDGVYHVEATRAAETVRSEHSVRVPEPVAVSATGTRIIEQSVYPTGAIALPEGELLEIGFQGAAGGAAAVNLPYGARVNLIEHPVSTGPTAEGRNFETTAPGARGRVGGVSWYRGAIAVESLLARDSIVPKPVLPETQLQRTTTKVDSVATDAIFELVIGADTARVPLPLNLAPIRSRVGVARPPAGAPADWTLRGRASTAGPYHWFFPPGTRLELTGERNGFVRARLAPDLSAWVPKAEVEILPAGAAPPRTDVGGVRFLAAPGHVDLRIPLGVRLPFAVDGTGRNLVIDVYGGTSETNFFQFGSLDPLITRAMWSQPADAVYRVSIELSAPVWGYLAFYDGEVLVLRIRRPPEIDGERPLAGLRIGVDAGHPPAGSIGPTRLSEADANLPIARALQKLLEAAGADVLMTRTDTASVELGLRPRMATDSNAHVMVSIHNNAFPDGVNPFENAGTSVYFYQPHSLDLARHVQRELLGALSTRDIGIGRADLAVVRPTWMPSILSETLYMMVPQHEAALRDPATQERIAAAHVRALEAFLRERRAAN
jgi:N-acetylmuramoyl-L-alanine amidase